MCRSIDKAGNRKNVRCASCENPEKRRARQNLSYHVNQAKNKIEAQSPSATLLDNHPTSVIEQETQSEIPQEVIDNRVAIVTKYREEAQSMSLEEWTKPQGEYKTAGEMLQLREKEISAIGAVVSARAQQIAGITYEEGLESLNSINKRTDDIYREMNRLASQRKELDAEYANERTEEYHEKLDALLQLQFRANERFGTESSLLLKEEKRLTSLFAESHRQSLSEVRDMGGTVETIGSTKFIASSFQEAIDKHIPSDWIEASNKTGKKLYVTSKSSRGYYEESKLVKTGKEEVGYESHPVTGDYFLTEDSKPHPEDCRYQDWVQDSDDGLWGGTAVEVADHTTPLKRLANGEYAPKGVGWKKGKIYTNVGIERMELEEVYHRTFTDKRTLWDTLPFIDVAVKAKNNKIENEEKFNQTSVHEFVHHMESMNHKMVSVQGAFYRRRTTNPDGTSMPLVDYGTEKRDVPEKVREDGFVVVYMGKDYGRNSRHKEVMTTGTEAILTGKYGGLIGTSLVHTRKDTDMLNFVLGSLSTL